MLVRRSVIFCSFIRRRHSYVTWSCSVHSRPLAELADFQRTSFGTCVLASSQSVKAMAVQYHPPCGLRFRMLLFVSLLASQTQFVLSQLTSSQQTEFLDWHNTYRRDVMPVACPSLPPMVWNSELATLAQNYADTCNYEHNANRASQQTTFRSVGENLFLRTGSNIEPERAVRGWQSEVADYNLATNTCSGVCGHYTQLVWRASTSVGCGATVCNTASTQNRPSWANPATYPNLHIVVCNYGPAGNFVGQAPYATGSCSPSTNPPSPTPTPSAAGAGNVNSTGPTTTTSAGNAVFKPEATLLLPVLVAIVLALLC